MKTVELIDHPNVREGARCTVLDVVDMGVTAAGRPSRMLKLEVDRADHTMGLGRVNVFDDEKVRVVE